MKITVPSLYTICNSIFVNKQEEYNLYVLVMGIVYNCKYVLCMLEIHTCNVQCVGLLLKAACTTCT